jgi:hypothetical protein
LGILADLLVASTADALLYNESAETRGSPSPDRFERVEYKHFSGLEFGTLWALIDGQKWDVHRYTLRHITHGDEGESWLEEFPAALVATLAAFDDSRVAGVAEAWGKTDELKWMNDGLDEVIANLVRLARLAEREEKGMFLWGSL